MSKPRLIALAAIAVLALGIPAAFATGPSVTYEVTITNLTDHQWLTPPAIATHDPRFTLFGVGSSATVAAQEIAENGNLAAATGAFLASDLVHDWKVAGTGPLAPGASVMVELTAPRWAELSFASMLICTNDGFTGLAGLALPRALGNETVAESAGYDAGTEVNTQLFADLVPPCQLFSGIDPPVGGTGLSNPALAENGVVRHHPGIVLLGQLNPAFHGWEDPVVSTVIERTG